ncbi:c-type cytochrome [Thiococcus pfennigii]|uniref:c-type cytochrome n=1 Tax=Thiococcus pfennigii TaxID=1057 RepID=UPI001902F823|nr:c-type cytochrome [Thiococcus pfennigii]MBK1702527.1 cytochrome C [Thiococcus pfennigii]MBK1733498.1 cytochrome C [Thiococcus pfennigii]
MFEKRLAWSAAALYLAAAWGSSAAQTPAEVAHAEYEAAMAATPNVENGRKIYLICSVCHHPEGWGTPDGVYPQIAGQLRTVIIKQLADIRAGNRDNPMMYPFAVPRILGSEQDIADVAAYVAGLPMTPENGIGPGQDLAHGEQLFATYCADCHGERGDGDAEDHIPAIAGQHYAYLMRQFELIRLGRRKNADPKMVGQIKDFSARDQSAVLDYTSRLRPPANKLAPTGWTNPDFPDHVRPEMPPAAR